jgi:hypothetical protein
MPAPRTDFFTFIHKAIRLRLFEAIVRLGRADLDDPATAASVLPDLRRLLRWLLEHSGHEDRFVLPLLRTCAPDVADRQTADHGGIDDALHALLRQLDDPPPGLELYRALNRFAAACLTHLDDEETRLSPLLWERHREDDLAAAMAAFNASRTPEQALSDLALMLPALAPSERRALLGRLPPPPVLTAVHDLLDPAERAELSDVGP